MKNLERRIRYSPAGIEVKLITVDAKELTSKERNNLPDSDFAYIEPGGKKVDGKTEPRSLRKFPIQDAAHVRSALSYLGKSDLSPEAKKSALKKIKIAAKKFGVTVSDSDGKTKEEWDKIDKKELKRDTKKEKEEHEKDAVKDDAERIKNLKKGKPSAKKKAETRDLKKDQKRDEKSEKKESTAESEKQKAAREKFMEMIRKKKKGGDDKKDDDKKDDDKKDDDKKDEKKTKGAYNEKGQYVPYEGAEPDPAVEFIGGAYNKKGEYVPYQGQEPNPTVQLIPESEAPQHKSFMSECMANDAAHANTEGLDEARSNLACALAYDNKFKTAHAPCIGGICRY